MCALGSPSPRHPSRTPTIHGACQLQACSADVSLAATVTLPGPARTRVAPAALTRTPSLCPRSQIRQTPSPLVATDSSLCCLHRPPAHARTPRARALSAGPRPRLPRVLAAGASLPDAVIIVAPLAPGLSAAAAVSLGQVSPSPLLASAQPQRRRARRLTRRAAAAAAASVPALGVAWRASVLAQFSLRARLLVSVTACTGVHLWF